jgi:protein-S-isoprenylcysteine O-methyltransferase Ste14
LTQFGAASPTTILEEPAARSATASVAESAPDEARARILASRLDWVEKLVVLALYAWLVWRILHTFLAEPVLGNLLLLPSEGLAVVFLLLRRGTTEISKRPHEWALAMTATCAPLLVIPGGTTLPLAAKLAPFVLLWGMLLQVHAKITLGRSFGCVPAHRGLKLGGPYRFVRHPMYAGYLLSHAAFLAMNPTVWNLSIYLIAYALQVPRLLAEERMLSHDPAYREYAATVRYRLVPRLF